MKDDLPKITQSPTVHPFADVQMWQLHMPAPYAATITYFKHKSSAARALARMQIKIKQVAS